MLAYIIAIFGVAFSTTDDARSESESSFIQVPNYPIFQGADREMHEDNASAEASSFALVDGESYPDTASFVHVGESLPDDASDLQAQEEIMTLREQVQNLEDQMIIAGHITREQVQNLQDRLQQERDIETAQRITNAENAQEEEEEDHLWIFDVFGDEETPQDHDDNISAAGSSFAVFDGASSYVNVGDDHSLTGEASDFRLQREIMDLREQVQNLQAQLQHERESTTTQRIADAENVLEENPYALQVVGPQTTSASRRCIRFKLNVKLPPIISCIFFGRPVPMLTWRSVALAIEDETEDNEPLVQLTVQQQYAQPSSSSASESPAVEQGIDAVLDFKARREYELLKFVVTEVEEVAKQVVPRLQECVERNAPKIEEVFECLEKEVVTHVVPEVKKVEEHVTKAVNGLARFLRF